MPVRNPGVGEKARRIDLQHFALALEFVHAVHGQGALPSGVAIAPSGPGLELEELGWAGFTGPPLPQLLGINQRPKNTLGRSSLEDFRDN